ncbi:MAG TPA: DUF1349 domain-containing protein [Candidatus Limiplasma sp.]|nr:DUF1349 domain-containing protein [Candidatus Limiplasma sp.]HRX07581.1 DUF1349 domain-containing protein [Candidatus Limiplasma sp.]
MDKTFFRDFQWMNESKARFTDDALVLYAPEQSDYFFGRYVEADPLHTPGISCRAPFYYTRVTGDFVLRAQVSHDFLYTFDASSIMVMHSLLVWAKACFEKTDFGTHAAVSVVTNHVSDDANGCNIAGNTLWMQVARAGNHFAFHYAQDGENFYMMRTFYLPAAPEIMVGFVPQSPVGKGGERFYRNISLTHKTVKDLRAGE